MGRLGCPCGPIVGFSQVARQSGSLSPLAAAPALASGSSPALRHILAHALSSIGRRRVGRMNKGGQPEAAYSRNPRGVFAWQAYLMERTARRTRRPASRAVLRQGVSPRGSAHRAGLRPVINRAEDGPARSCRAPSLVSAFSPLTSYFGCGRGPRPGPVATRPGPSGRPVSSVADRVFALARKRSCLPLEFGVL